jgi:hypothetical protein
MSTTSSATLVKQELIAKLDACHEKLLTLIVSLPDQLEELPAAEAEIRRVVLELGRELLQAWSETADAKASAPPCAACQQRMRHKGYVQGPLVTTLGNVRVRRVRFRCSGCGAESYPHDTWLRFLGHSVSPLLAKVIARMGAQLPFGQAQQNLKADYGVHLAKRTMQLVCEEAGMAVVDEEDQQRTQLQSLPPAQRPAALPDSEIRPEKAYVYADGTMIHSAGDWHEVRVASVASVDEDDQPLKIDHRARFLSGEDFGWQLLLLARSAGYHHAQQRAFIADGARWLWEQAAMHFPDAVQILDWYHLAEHIHQTANVLHAQGSPQAKRFSKQRLNELWEGRSSQTLRRLKELRKKTRAPAKREALRKLIGYIENNRGRINYPKYRELGLRVGSGQVEGACKTLVGTRCKQAGMRNWTRRGAQGVLRIRTALQTGQYDALWKTLTNIAA